MVENAESTVKGKEEDIKDIEEDEKLPIPILACFFQVKIKPYLQFYTQLFSQNITTLEFSMLVKFY